MSIFRNFDHGVWPADDVEGADEVVGSTDDAIRCCCCGVALELVLHGSGEIFLNEKMDSCHNGECLPQPSFKREGAMGAPPAVHISPLADAWYYYYYC